MTDEALKTHARTGDWMQTYSGRRFWPLDPRPFEIDIEDIAHALSLQCRYAGHCHQFYSVAEHSVLLARHLDLAGHGPDVALWALLHDASEAYVTDVIRPLKPFLINYRVIEKRVMDSVCERFRLKGPMPDVVHEADDRIIADERLQNLKWMTWDREPGPVLGVELQFWSPFNAKRMFLTVFRQLMEERGTDGGPW